jgi:hypothetical protein
MDHRVELQQKIHSLTTELANELISLTPEFMDDIQFEIVSTADGGANIGLIEIRPEVKYVELSPKVYDFCKQYLPMIRQLSSLWKRSLVSLREAEGHWKITVDFEYAE